MLIHIWTWTCSICWDRSAQVDCCLLWCRGGGCGPGEKGDTREEQDRGGGRGCDVNGGERSPGKKIRAEESQKNRIWQRREPGCQRGPPALAKICLAELVEPSRRLWFGCGSWRKQKGKKKGKCVIFALAETWAQVLTFENEATALFPKCCKMEAAAWVSDAARMAGPAVAFYGTLWRLDLLNFSM